MPVLRGGGSFGIGPKPKHCGVGEERSHEFLCAVHLPGLATDGRVQRQAVGTTVGGDEFEEALSEVGQLAFPDPANAEKRKR